MGLRPHACRLAALVLLLLLCINPFRSAPVFAKDLPPADEVQWVALNALPGGSLGPTGAIRFQAQVSFQLQSALSGFVTLFVFENDAKTSSLHSPHVQTVSTGDGKAQLDMVYVPHAGVQKLTLLAGLFKEDETLLAWTATNAVSLSDWEAKVAFAGAVNDQQAGKYAAATLDLTTAIQLAPEVGNFYYWRADDQSRLGQYDGAIADFTQALQLMPLDRPSLLGRGVARLWKGDAQGSVADLSGVIAGKAGPDDLSIWAYRARGTAEADLGQVAAAVDDYQMYLSLAPDAVDRAQISGWIGQLQSQIGG